MRSCNDSMAATGAVALVGICEDGTGVVVGAKAITDTLAVKRSDTVTIPLAARSVGRYGRSAIKGYGHSGDADEDRISKLLKPAVSRDVCAGSSLPQEGAEKAIPLWLTPGMAGFEKFNRAQPGTSETDACRW